MISWNDFDKVEIRVGTVLEADDFPEARNPSYKLKIDFEKFGIKQSSAQITELYKKEDLIGKTSHCCHKFSFKTNCRFYV